ncbi:hypothetical protein ACQ4PT_060402 [Festuca glaucescens]
MYEQWLSKDEYKFMGLDFEYCDPEYEGDYRIAVVQLAMKDHVLVYQWSSSEQWCPKLMDFLRSGVHFASVDIRNDKIAMQQSWNIEIPSQYHIDLQDLFKLERDRTGMADMAAGLIDMSYKGMKKEFPSVQHKFWEKNPLDEINLEYAARDGFVAFMLDVFDPATGTFEIGENNGTVSLGFVEVECLLGLANEAATRRDNFDYENGRGRGNVKIDENITEEYQLMEPVVPDPVPAPQDKAKPASDVPKKKQAPKPIDNGQTEILINRLTGYLDQQVQKLLASIPGLCAQRTLEMFNKEGVTYKPAAAAVSGNMEDQEDVNSFRNGPRVKKEFMYKEESDSAGGGDSIHIIDMTLPDEVEKHRTHFKKPAKNGTAKNANDAMRTPAKASGLNGTPAEKPFAMLVIDGYIGHLNLRAGHDRFLCPAWRSKYLVDRANAGDKPQESSKNMDSAMVRSGAVGRVVAEYTVRDKVYFPLNIGNTHWTTVVMHIPKQEFQVLDSIYPLEFTLETVEALRRQIAQDMQVANEMTSGNHPDVSKWPILEYDMPQQHDGNSCGLFVIECMEHWDGDRITAEISQIKVNARRRRVVAEMMLSPSNMLEMVKERIRFIASRINKKT